MFDVRSLRLVAAAEPEPGETRIIIKRKRRANLVKRTPSLVTQDHCGTERLLGEV